MSDVARRTSVDSPLANALPSGLDKYNKWLVAGRSGSSYWTSAMGIKFLCPGGHKLHVKAFLAGRKAVCPKCGQKVLVPTESESQFAGKKELHAGSIGEASNAGSAGSVSATLEMPIPLDDLPHSSRSSNTVADPISEDPDAVWYVRPQSGGQFGPASGETMRSWVTEGRVAGNSLVWRAGWPDWQLADLTFPHLASTTPPATPTSVLAAPISPPSPRLVTSSPVVAQVKSDDLPYGEAVRTTFEPSPISGIDEAAVRTRPRRKGADTTIVLSGILFAVVIVLFIVLGIVLSRQGSPEATPPAKTPSAKPSTPEKSEKKAGPEAPKAVPEDELENDSVKPAEE